MSDRSVTRTVLLDTNCFIYLLEDAGSPKGQFIDELVRSAVSGAVRLVTSSVCLSEFLVGVARHGTEVDVQRMMSRFVALPGLAVLPVTNDIAAAAAIVRSRAGVRLFDALVVATGQVHAVDELVTNDSMLARARLPIPCTYLEDVAT